jgi:hypothetical protein
MNDKTREKLVKLGLDPANLRDADLRGADLRVADLYVVDLRDANLSAADLRDANLRGANLRYADLREADLRYADLGGADLSGADMSGANLSGADLSGADLRGAFGPFTAFSAGKHVAIFAGGYGGIGCCCYPYREWLNSGEAIGAGEGYTPEEIADYMSAIRWAVARQMRIEGDDGGVTR